MNEDEPNEQKTLPLSERNLYLMPDTTDAVGKPLKMLFILL